MLLLRWLRAKFVWKPFSKRESSRPDLFRYDVPLQARHRVFHTFNQRLGSIGSVHLSDVLREVRARLLAQYGGLCVPTNLHAGFDTRDPVILHFLCCDDELALDFIEFCLQVPPYFHASYCVDPINAVFRDEGIGYELTALIEKDGGPGNLFGHSGGRRIEHEFPRFIKMDSQYVHQAIVRPCLDALSQPEWQVAHSEMMSAHTKYREGSYADAITACGSSFESVLKTICHHKGWAFDEKDTCAKLVKACKDNSLFPPFYVPLFEAVGTIRNNLSAAHGRGPGKGQPVEKKSADHMIQTTSAHITFLVKRADL